MTTPHDIFASAIRDFYAIAPHEDIVTWAEANIDFSADISAERSRIDFSISPFLIEPLRAWEFTGRIREVAVCGIEQHGKTLLESIGVLYNFIFKPCSNLCIYPSDDDARDINETKYLPLIKKIPALAAELSRPFSSGKDHYIFGAATMFFQGAGAKIMSKSCKIVVLDEEDHYPVVGNLSAAEDSKKRVRSYTESIVYRVCTPTEKSGPIWKAFLAGSQGYWTLRCQSCGELTMRSCDFKNFQFESYFDEQQKCYYVIQDSIRLICPVCHHEHSECDKVLMNQQGAYCHQYPDRLDCRPSFQFGALASQLPYMNWGHIAGKILECGKRADIKAHYELDNSYKGLPYSPRAIAKEDLENMKSHFYHALPPSSEIEMVFVVSDTQDTFSPTGVFALTASDNLYLIKYANLPYLSLSQAAREQLTDDSIETVEDWLDTPVRFPDGESITPLFHVVDYRGHRQDEIKDYAATHRNVFMYAGAKLMPEENFRDSTKIARMLIVNARLYQRNLIWQLYNQKDKKTNYLYLPENLDVAYQEEISCIQPDKTRKSGHLFENWVPQHDAVHDCFDVLKMAYFALDYAISKFDRKRFRIGRSPMLCRRHKKTIKMQR